MQRKPWRTAFRAFLPSLPTTGLEFLLHALRTDSPELVQETTVAGDTNQPGAVGGACAIGYVAWRGFGLRTTFQVDHHFGRLCKEADTRLGELCGSDPFIDYFDNEARAVSFPAIALEVAAELERREAEAERVNETVDSLAAA